MMERNEDHDSSDVRILGDESNVEVDSSSLSSSVLRSALLLDNVGEVALNLNSDGLSWELLDSVRNEDSICLGIKLAPKIDTEIKFSDICAVELINHGLVHGYRPIVGKAFLHHDSCDSVMYRFSVHGVCKSITQPCLWVLVEYTFGHKDLQTCQIWVDRINASLNLEVGRPKNLLVFVHPLSGKANGCKTWEKVAPIFLQAKVETKVIVTQRARHAFDVMTSTTNKELALYDGVIAVGGDGFFNEILNGLFLSRHKAPYPPSPSDLVHSDNSNGTALSPNVPDPEYAHENEGNSPLLSNSTHNGSRLATFGSEDGSGNAGNQDLDFPLPSEQFRFGIIPAGSTDAIVMCTTGTRDPITSALQIILGKRVSLDVAQVVRWKTTSTSDVEPCVRYAASFAGYGFYGDVITESEKYRWMGPKRYDYAGTKVFMRHRSYEAEVAYVETESDKISSKVEKGHLVSRLRSMRASNKSERLVCRINCGICNLKPVHECRTNHCSTPYSCTKETRWKRSKGRFLSVGAAIMSNRNERAPDGLVVDAHLSDGFLHLLLIRDCPRALYLWHLTQLAKRGGKPLNFEFVEHHKTPAFTFTSVGHESVWNLDGELFPAHQLSAQVFRGLISLFATGPEI